MTPAKLSPARLAAIQKFHAINPKPYQHVVQTDGLDLDQMADDLMGEARNRIKSALVTANQFVSAVDEEALAKARHEATVQFVSPTNLLLYSPEIYEELRGGMDMLWLHDFTMELLSLVAFASPDRVDDCLGRYAEAIEIYQLCA